MTPGPGVTSQRYSEDWILKPPPSSWGSQNPLLALNLPSSHHSPKLASLLSHVLKCHLIPREEVPWILAHGILWI